MTPDLFRATGEALYGRNWKSELGEKLSVGERQIRRWATGEYAPPAGVWAELAGMIADRQQALEMLVKSVSNLADGA